MPKGRLQIRLSEKALENLEQRAKAAGLTRQAYIETWLAGSHTPERMPARKPDSAEIEAAKQLLAQANRDRANERDWPAGQEWDELAPSSQQTFLREARAEKKAARATRKAALVETVKEALPRTDMSPLKDDIDRAIQTQQNGCQHPAASRTTGKNWKCTACGYQHEANQ